MAADDYTISEAIGADVIDESPNTLLVQFSPTEVDSVDKHSAIGQLAQIDDIDPGKPIVANGRALLDNATLDRGGTGIAVTFRMNGGMSSGLIEVGNGTDEVTISGSRLASVLEHVLRSFDEEEDEQDDIELDNSTATELYETYEEIIEFSVREDVIEQIRNDLGLFHVDSVDDGWLIEDTYIVTYEAENYLAGDVATYERNGDSVLEIDGEKQAVGMEFDVDGRLITEIGDNEYILSQTEQEFLAMAEVLLWPAEYLEVNSFESEVYHAINKAKYDDTNHIKELASTVNVSHYIDPATGLLHRHDLAKHVLQSSFQVNQWVIDDLFYNSFDHAGLAELAWREDELRESTRDVFWDTDNNDGERWQEIQDAEDKAPCPPEVYQRLRSTYGN